MEYKCAVMIEIIYNVWVYVQAINNRGTLDIDTVMHYI